LLIIQKWEKLPAWFIWGLVALWIAKDAILFPFVWRSYDWSHPSDEFNSLIGTEGTAMEPLTPSGYIKIRGELWKAVVANENAPVEKGEAIRVKGNQGLTLIVEPVREISPHNRSSSDI